MRFAPIIHRLLLAAGMLCAAAAPLRAEMAPMTPSETMGTQPVAESTEASVLDWLEQQGGATLLASNSFSNEYLTPHGFSRNLANDALTAPLHLERVDPELPSSDPYDAPRRQLRVEQEVDPAVIALTALGVLTASVSGILLYARNPIPRKRKYRRSPEERQKQHSA